MVRRYDPCIDSPREGLSGAGAGSRPARVLTGYRPTGALHVGHWFGVILSMLRLQEAQDAFFFIADWHALTTDYEDTSRIPENVRGLVLDWLAAGLDPVRSTIYLQSQLPEVAELALVLGMVTPLSWLERVPTFKERLRDLSEREIANYGLLGYPVLQAADIAIVRGELVPVGEDQLPHLELSREIVRRFNRFYGDVLVEPRALLSETPLIPGSDGRKMSKSLHNDIGLREDPDTMRSKIKRFVTDPRKVRLGDAGRPEICPVYALHRQVSHDILEWTEAGCRAGTLPCVRCKTNLADRMVAHFAPFRERREALEEEPGCADEALAIGHEKVRPVVDETMKSVRSGMRLA